MAFLQQVVHIAISFTSVFIYLTRPPTSQAVMIYYVLVVPNSKWRCIVLALYGRSCLNADHADCRLCRLTTF